MESIPYGGLAFNNTAQSNLVQFQAKHGFFLQRQNT
jgi:hypothetical protein